MAKLSKRDIREGLEAIPMETLLSPKGKKVNLTAKQKAFAKNVALGMTKAKAYREAYNSKAKPNVSATRGHELAKRSDIQVMIEAHQEAIEASKYRTPAQLRELVIHQLTIHALSEENSPRDRLSALKMLGTVAEVGAFVERKESLVIHESSKVKADLMAKLKDIVGGEIKEVDTSGADDLLRILNDSKKGNSDTHPHPTPPNAEFVGSKHLHNIPDSQSLSELDQTEGTPIETVWEEAPPPDNGEVPPMGNGSPA